MWLGADMLKPSEEMRMVLTGELPHDEATPAVQSMCRREFFAAAVVIVKMESKETRRKALQRIPEGCRHRVELEVKRLWPIRNTLGG